MTILVADGHPLIRKGITTLVTESLADTTCYEAGDIPQALDILRTKKPDIMMLGFGTQFLDGMYLLRYFQHHGMKKFKIIVITQYTDPILVNWLMDYGVEGYVSMVSSLDNTVNAIRSVSKGFFYYPEEFERIAPSANLPSLVLSSGDQEILALVANGDTSKEIAGKLGYTLRTIETKRRRLEKKLLVRNSSELVSVAYRIGLLKVGHPAHSVAFNR